MLRLYLDGKVDKTFVETFLNGVEPYLWVTNKKMHFLNDSSSILVSSGVPSNEPFDVVILLKNSVGNWTLARDGIVLFDGTDRTAIRRLSSLPYRAVSCGFSEKDTVTVSSCQNGSLNLFVQREIPFRKKTIGIGETVWEYGNREFDFSMIYSWIIRAIE